MSKQPDGYEDSFDAVTKAWLDKTKNHTFRGDFTGAFAFVWFNNGWEARSCSTEPPVSKELLDIILRYLKFLFDSSGATPLLSKEDFIKLSKYVQGEQDHD